MENCKTILIVEDDHEIRVNLRKTLEADGYEVLSAANGKDALDILAKAKKPALILLDVMMPVMDGKTLLGLLKKDVMLTPIPVVLLSEKDHDDSHHTDHEIIKKPLDYSIVLKIAHQHCQKKSK